VCIFKSVTGCTYDGSYKTKSVCFNNNKIKPNEELIVVILNGTWLHNQTGGWTGT
jgi:hypothetical protein